MTTTSISLPLACTTLIDSGSSSPSLVAVALVGVAALAGVAAALGWQAFGRLRARRRAEALAAAQERRQVAVRIAELEVALVTAQAATNARSRMLASMSHEIRTPMSGILGLCELLLESRLDQDQRELAQTIHNSGFALVSILNDVLDASKIEAGKLTIQATAFELRSAVRDVVSLLQPQAAAKGIGLRLHIAAELPAAVVGDAGRLRQVLTNMVGNAVKFTASGEVQLTVEAGAERTPGRASLRFAVADTGIGIAAAVQPRLFQEFTQADSSISRRFGGTGLGLAICKQLVTLMGGEIGLRSEVGTGSTFWFTLSLPIAAMPPPPALPLPAVDARPPAGPRRRVLLAEDNEVTQNAIARILGRLGYEVDVAENGRVAVELANVVAYDLILMDCQMPQMDGFEATAAIRAQQATGGHRAPIVALTADAMEGAREHCLAAGMDDYASKPLRGSALAELMLRWVGRTPAAAPATVGT